MSSWIDAIFGVIRSTGTAVELEGGLDFRAPLTATRDATAGTVKIELDESALDVTDAVDAALESVLGDPLPAAGVFQAPLPTSVSAGPSGYVAPLGPVLDAEEEIADAGDEVFTITLPASKRCKITLQIDATGEDGTAYELAARIIAHTDGTTITAYSSYVIDGAVDADDEVDPLDFVDFALSDAGLVLTITVSNDAGQDVTAIVVGQLEHRNHPAAP